jgi:AcrR family transcriptional regulator
MRSHLTETRDRLVEVSAALLQRQGLTGTGIKQILAEAGAPYSSLYHHFPGGKVELADNAIRASGARYQALIEAVWDQAPDVISAVAAIFEAAALALESSDFAVACPIATVALEVANTNERLRQTTAEVFDAWIASGAARFELAGIAPGDARTMALTLIALLEGAFILSQSSRNLEPLRAAGAAAVAAAHGALATSTNTPRTRKRITNE